MSIGQSSTAAYKPMTTAELLTRYAQGERDFKGIDLTGADLQGATLGGVDLSRAQIKDVNLDAADTSECVLTGATMPPGNVHD